MKLIKALVQCAKAESPIFLDEEMFESSIDDELTFGLVDAIKKNFQEMVKNIQCSVGVIGEVIGEGELKNVYEDFMYNVTKLLRTDVPKCAKTKGLTGKLK